jgi:hypothetical protein
MPESELACVNCGRAIIPGEVFRATLFDPTKSEHMNCEEPRRDNDVNEQYEE